MFSSEDPALVVLPFLRQLVKISNQSHLYEAALLWIVEEGLRSPARDAFRTQPFFNCTSAVHCILNTYVRESALDAAVRTSQTTIKNPMRRRSKIRTPTAVTNSGPRSALFNEKVKSLFTQGLRDSVKLLFAANQPIVEFEEVTPLIVLIGRADLLETGTKQTTFVRSSPRYNPVR
jgi:hypothetical protein